MDVTTPAADLAALPANENSSPEAIPADARQAAELAHRLHRIDDLRGAALANPDPRTAVLAAANADLCEVGAFIGHQVCKILREQGWSTDSAQMVTPAIAQVLKIDQQLANLTQLELKLAAMASSDQSQPPQ